MTPLYGFGFSQEDERTVAEALDVRGQTVLCVASAGDIPLSLLSMGAQRVIAVDISEAQLRLCRLKAAAVQRLDQEAAAGLLGFLPAPARRRRVWLAECLPGLPQDSANFWRAHEDALFRHGAIWCGRYERFIRATQMTLRPFLGAAFEELARTGDISEQRAIFDRRIGRPWLRAFFRVAFSRRVYSGHGIDKQGLAQRGREIPLGEQYWSKLRAFCTATPARLNPWLQLYTTGRLVSLDAAPYYLGLGYAEARREAGCLTWVRANLLDYAREALPPEITRVFLSNLPDWCSASDFERLLSELAARLPLEARILWSFLHVKRALPAYLPGSATVCALGLPDLSGDRCPFYGFSGARLSKPDAKRMTP